ncbi:hypothetical protein [Halalkalicoccus ordinarius]|uniref:hypothetical protein n=1 Tax=Halalkalicoccus ordinarius TaxID=3116651 RepID=UPI00300EB9B7
MSDPDAEDDGPEYDIDFRENPEEYEIGRGEEGVLKHLLPRSFTSFTRWQNLHENGPRSLRSLGPTARSPSSLAELRRHE